MAKRKLDAKAFASQKRKRRQWLTFVRMCRYGINNFSRNAWLTVAATAVMTITLLIIFTTMVARQVLADTVTQIKDKVDMSLYIKNDTPEAAVAQIRGELESLSSVKSVSYVSPQQARDTFVEQNKSDEDALGALKEAKDKLPGTFRVSVNNINDLSQLENFKSTSELYKKSVDTKIKEPFDGKRGEIIEDIGRTVGFAETVGLAASIFFVVLSSLIVFNTIRMAIFNRKEEIQMMKLIGADRSFIRGPFVVEAVVYGFIAAVLATGLGLLALYASKDGLTSYGIAIGPTVERMTIYVGFILLAMIITGAVIGVISSLLATRKYLKL
jgi:cell division transport system permease protein